MKKILCLLLCWSSLTFSTTHGEWPNKYFRRICYVENKKQAPDINTYEWLRHIYKQCPDITLNKQIQENVTFYRAVILNNTEKNTKKLNQYVKTWSKIVLRLTASVCGFFLTIKGCQEYINMVTTEPAPPFKEGLHSMIKNCAIITVGACLATSFLNSIKIYKTYAKRKKTLEINKIMMSKLESFKN